MHMRVWADLPDDVLDEVHSLAGPMNDVKNPTGNRSTSGIDPETQVGIKGRPCLGLGGVLKKIFAKQTVGRSNHGDKGKGFFVDWCTTGLAPANQL